jgi:outer membrane protein assembly factor BamD
VYYILGLEKEAKKYAVLLGYNYQSSEWYEKSYKVFNNTYEKQSQKIAKDDNVLKKIKSIFD